MISEKYLEHQFEIAKNFLKNTVGLKPVYFRQDAFDVLKEFGYVLDIDLEELSNFLPSKGYDLSSIRSLTHDYIKSDNYKIYAIRMEKHFNIFIIEFNPYREIIDYYSITISEETLKICFILECMKFKS